MMKTLDLQDETLSLLAKEVALYRKEVREYIAWAIRLLENGYESENLLILAGLDEKDVWEVDKYFKLAVDDLGIDIEVWDEESLDYYVVYLAKQVVANPAKVDKVVDRLNHFLYKTKYHNNKHLNFVLFYVWDELGELGYKDEKAYALEEFKAFLKEERL